MVERECVTEPILWCVKSGDDVRIKKDPCCGGYTVWINGLCVMRIVSEGEHCRGMRSNMIMYEDGVDKKIVDEVLIPLMIEAYSGGELCEPMIICRKDFESRYSPEKGNNKG